MLTLGFLRHRGDHLIQEKAVGCETRPAGFQLADSSGTVKDKRCLFEKSDKSQRHEKL